MRQIKRPIRAALVIAAMFLSFGSAAYAEDPYDIAWMTQLGTSDYDVSNGVAVDAFGYIYISGHTDGILGDASMGSTDAFLTKFDRAGNVMWTQQTGTWERDYSQSVAVDTSGNVYITGHTYDAPDKPLEAGIDIFLTKFSNSGDRIWSQKIGSPEPERDYSFSVAVDATGNAYIGGYTAGSLTGINGSGNDAFLAKYDGSGNQLWAHQLDASLHDQGRAVAVDGSGNVYISGETYGRIGESWAGSYDAFLVKYDEDGVNGGGKM